MHQPYQNKFGYQAHFKVIYRFYSVAEGGRHSIPFQGYRSDFWYYHPAHNGTNQLFMIWSEFLDESGAVILDNQIPVPLSGVAQMWIINTETQIYHSDKIKLGLKGCYDLLCRCGRRFDSSYQRRYICQIEI